MPRRSGIGTGDYQIAELSVGLELDLEQLDLDAALADKTVSELITKLNHRAKQLEIRAEIDLTNLEGVGTEIDRLHAKEARLNEILDVQRKKLQLLREQYEKALSDKNVGDGVRGRISNSVLLQELEVAKVEAAIRGLSSETASMTSMLGVAEAAAGLTGATIVKMALDVFDLAKYAAKSGQEIGRFADDLETTAEEARGLSIALSLGGVSADTFSHFITGLDRRIQSVGAAGEEARENLYRFGVSLHDDEGQLVGYTEQLKRLAEGYRNAKDAGMGNEYLSALGTGAEALRDVLESYDEIERIRSRMDGLFDAKSAEEFVAQSKELDDRMKELSLSVDQIKVSLGAAFLPFIADIAPKVTEAVGSITESIGELSEKIRKRYKNLSFQFGGTRSEYDAAMHEEAERELRDAEESERKKAEARAKIRERELEAYENKILKFSDKIQDSLDSNFRTDLDNRLYAIDKQAEKYRKELENTAKEFHTSPDEDSLALIDKNAQIQKDKVIREFSEQTSAYLDNIYETLLQKRLNQIEREKRAWIQKGMDEVKATEAAETAKLDAQRNAALQVIKAEREQLQAYRRGGEEAMKAVYMRQNGFSERDLKITSEELEAYEYAKKSMMENLLPYFSTNREMYLAMDKEREARNVIRGSSGDWLPISAFGKSGAMPSSPPISNQRPIEINVNIENAVTQNNEGIRILADAVADKITPAIETAIGGTSNAY